MRAISCSSKAACSRPRSGYHRVRRRCGASSSAFASTSEAYTREPSMPRTLIAVALCCATTVAVVHTQDKLDYAMFSRIRDEGFARSQALDHVSWLADVYGPRLQGS